MPRTIPSAEQLRDAFSRELRATVSPALIDKINDENRRFPKKPCTTHDYCDVNQTMLHAWASLGFGLNVDDSVQINRSNLALKMARDASFSLEPPTVDQLCESFIRQLQQTLTVEQLEEVRHLNQHASICPANDFCDLDGCIALAWEALGHPLDLLNEQQRNQSVLAWAKVREQNYTPSLPEPLPPMQNSAQLALDAALTYIEFPERVNVDQLCGLLKELGAKHIAPRHPELDNDSPTP